MDTTPKALVTAAIILGISMIIAADFLSGRYQITGTQYVLYRLDHFTGSVTACTVNSDEYGAAADAGKTGVLAHCDIVQGK